MGRKWDFKDDKRVIEENFMNLWNDMENETNWDFVKL